MSLGKYFAVRQQDALQNGRGSHAAAANADADSTASAAADSSIDAAQTIVKGYYSRISERRGTIHQFERIRYDARNTK